MSAAPRTTDDALPVDLAQLHLFTEGDAAEEQALLTLFLAQAEQSIAAMTACANAASMEAWKAAAHRFKGAAISLGAYPLYEVCAEAEALEWINDSIAQDVLVRLRRETMRVAAFFGR